MNSKNLKACPAKGIIIEGVMIGGHGRIELWYATGEIPDEIGDILVTTGKNPEPGDEVWIRDWHIIGQYADTIELRARITELEKQNKQLREQGGDV